MLFLVKVMETVDKILLIFIYGMTNIICFSASYKRIKSNKRIEIIDFFNLYYIIVYFFTPMFSFYNFSPKFTRYYLDFFNYDLKYHVLSYVLALVFFIILNISYKKIKSKTRITGEVRVDTSTFLALNITFSIIGIVSYYLWSKVYGFPFGIIKYADALRDNRRIMYNPYTIFQPFSKFSVYASYMWLILLKDYKSNINKIMSFIMFIFTFFFAILATLATDSRMAIITLFLVPLFYFINEKEIKIKKIVFLGIIIIILLGNLDNVTYYIRNKHFKNGYDNNNNNIFILLSNEFGFTYANRINILYNMENDTIEYTEIQDIKNIIFAWLPKRMKQNGFKNLGKYNTELYPNPTGTIPTDIVTASIYKGKTFGILLMPIFMSILLKYLGEIFANKNNDFDKIIFYEIGVSIMLRCVAYYDMSELLSGRIALIIFCFVIYLLCKRRKKNELY